MPKRLSELLKSPLPVALTLALLRVAPSSAQCTSGTSIAQYRCWEQQIVSSVDFYNGGAGNPYRDLTLRVTFSGPGGSFTQDAFWVGDTTNATTARNFKVRAALPAGSWTWSVAGCTGTTGGRSCASGVTWTPSSGAINVLGLATANRLYTRGFLTQTSGSGVYQPLTYGDRVTPFFWVGDSAWSAPAFEIDAQLHGGSQFWSQYLAARSPDSQVWSPPPYQHFAASAIMVAPAAHWAKENAGDVFQTPPGCALAPALGSSSWNSVRWYPNNCSIPNPAYWNAFDNLIKQATNSDLVVLIAGLIHPLNLGSNPPYPTYSPPSDVARFSRYMAARMAGFAVMFSPGFDMPLTAKAADGSTGRNLMDASGTAVRAASPRALVTAHLNGSALCGDYRSFATVPAPWMTFNLFHSGHAFAAQPVTTDPCPGWQSGSETRVQAALRRATVMPATLSAYTAPNMPSINAEGPYDDVDNLQTDYTLVDTRYRLRQACNYSSLSNARGCSYAITQVGLWSSPGSYVGTRASETDMQSLAGRFRPYAGLISHPEWIVNNPTPYDQRMALASDGSSVAIAYVPPANPASPAPNASVTISTGGLPGLACSGEWTLMWTDPTQEADPLPPPANGCQQSAGQITVTVPPCDLSKAPECDWILTMTRGKAITTLPTGAVAPDTLSSPGFLDVWRAPGEGDGTSAILAQPSSSGRSTPPIVVSPSGLAFQDGARIARAPGGYVVVWHADSLDGWLLGVFGQRLDAAGKLRGPMFRVNSTIQFDQRDPDIAVDPEGNTVVVWESYGQDGDLGGIFGQLYDRAGMPVGGEFAINEIGRGHQVRPRAAYLAGGGFVVGWTTEALGTDPGAVSFRVFDRSNLPATGEIRLPGGASFHPKLADLSASARGGLHLRWFLQDNALRTIVSYLREFSEQGAATGAAGVLP